MLTRNGASVLVGGVLFLASGLLFGYAEVGAVGLALLFAVLGGFAWVGTRARLEVERRLDRDRVTVGDVALGLLTVTNTAGRTAQALSAFERVGDGSIQIPVPRLAAGKRRAVRYQLPTARRCVLRVGPLRLVRSDPFGLVRFEQSHGDERVLYVHPRRHLLRRLPATLLRSLDGPTSDTAPRGTVVFHALREYVAGDDRRHIHWRSTARVGDLMVRQYVDTSLPDLTVLLDNAAAHHSTESFEQAVEVAASILSAASDAGFPARLITTDAQTLSPTGPQATQQMLDHLAGLQSCAIASLGGALEGLRAGGNTLIVITRDLDPHDSALLAARRSTYRSVIVVTIDPDGDGRAVGIHPGIRLIRGSTAADAMGQWNARVPT